MNEHSRPASAPQAFEVGQCVRVGASIGYVVAIHPEHGVKVRHEAGQSIWHLPENVSRV